MSAADDDIARTRTAISLLYWDRGNIHKHQAAP